MEIGCGCCRHGGHIPHTPEKLKHFFVRGFKKYEKRTIIELWRNDAKPAPVGYWLHGEITMTQSINKVILVGNLGKDPELRYTPSGKPVATLSVATSTRTKNRQTNGWEDVTQWHRVVVLGDVAQWAGEHLTKGRTVLIEGSLKYGSYTNKGGVRIPTVEIITFQVEPFGAKRPSEGGQEAQGQGGAAPVDDHGSDIPADLQDWVRSYDQA